MSQDDFFDGDNDKQERLTQFERWRDETGLVVDSGMEYAMHDSLYSNPEQAEAYEEADELGVNGLAYAIWKLGWDDHVDKWIYDDEVGWRREGVSASAEDKNDSVEDESFELTLNDFAAPEISSEGSSDEIWVYDYSPDGYGRWTNLQTGERSYRKRRPGHPPEDGDGYDDYLPGWKKPPELVNELEKGQLLGVQLSDQEPELAVVMNISGDSVSIRTEYPDHLFAGDDYITILAVEDRNSSEFIKVPEWAESYRDS